MELDDLRTFIEVADTGGVSAAARRLGVSKSIVSRKLARLEGEFGAQLLARNTRGASLTEAGITFRDHAVRVCAELDSAREALQPAGDLRGRLRIAAPLTFGPTHLAPLLVEMAEAHPLLQIDVSYSDYFVDIVAEGYDCAVRLGILVDSSLVARRIGPFPIRLVASPGYIARHGAPSEPGEIASHEAVARGDKMWQFVDGERTVSVQPRGRFRTDDGRAMITAVVAGLGITALPEFLMEAELASGALVPIMQDYPVPEGGIYLLRPPGRHAPRKVRVLGEMMAARFGRAARRAA